MNKKVERSVTKIAFGFIAGLLIGSGVGLSIAQIYKNYPIEQKKAVSALLLDT